MALARETSVHTTTYAVREGKDGVCRVRYVGEKRGEGVASCFCWFVVRDLRDLGRTHRVLLAEVVGDLAGVGGDGDGGVELLELGRARLGAVLADVGLGEVKLRAQIGELARGGVLDGDRLDPREDDVLGDLGAQALHAADEHGGTRQLPHALAAVHRELTRVEILIDLARRGHRVVRVVSRALLLRVRLLCLGVSFRFSLSSRR